MLVSILWSLKSVLKHSLRCKSTHHSTRHIPFIVFMDCDLHNIMTVGDTISETDNVAATLSNGQIAAVKVSLISPFYGMCLAVLNEIKKATKTPDVEGFILAASHRTRVTNVSCLTKCLAGITASVEKRLSKGERPAVVCQSPDWGDSSLSWVYPMGTFDGLNADNLPDVFKRFAVPVWQPGSSLEADTLKTIPSWKCSKRDAEGRARTQWFIGIPVELDQGERPTKPWTPGYGKRPYHIESEAFRMLHRRCLKNVQAFFLECRTEPWRLDQFYKALRSAEQVCSIHFFEIRE